MVVLPEIYAPVLTALMGVAKTAVPNTPHPTFFEVPFFHTHLPSLPVRALGFAGQALFSGRVILQAWASRQKGESHTPPSYWTFSWAAGLLLATYCFIISEPVGLLMQALMSPIYMRNLYMIYKEMHGPVFPRRRAKTLAFFCMLIFVFFFAALLLPANSILKNAADPTVFIVPLLHWHLPAIPVDVWGFVAMTIFMGRFFVQWLASERARRSVVPTNFWILASIGSLMLLAYFFVRSEPVQMLGQISTVPAYIYNLHLIRRQEQ